MSKRAGEKWAGKVVGLGRAMREEMGCGFQTVVRLLILYAAEVVVLTTIHRFLPPEWFRWLFIPVVVAVIAIGWLMVSVQVRRRGR
jgi:uncharacterized BrkB/YihY/UPF0761 family membrane protein